MEMLEKVRSALRIKHTNLDEELKDEIKSCQIDLRLAGVVKTEESDKLVGETIKAYCKWKHDFNGQGERWQRDYERLKNTLSLSSEYGGGTSEE